MSAKFTPGPWVYAESGPGQKVTTVAHCARFVIGLACSIPGGNYRDGNPCGDEEADARLIAAAPELLEALRAMTERWEPDTEGADRRMWENARAAIAKATGGSSMNRLVPLRSASWRPMLIARQA